MKTHQAPNYIATIANVILILGLACGIIIAKSTTTRAEQFHVALLTKDFGNLPLFVGIRAGLFAQKNLEIQLDRSE